MNPLNYRELLRCHVHNGPGTLQYAATSGLMQLFSMQNGNATSKEVVEI